jgi:hypothetical protein
MPYLHKCTLPRHQGREEKEREAACREGINLWEGSAVLATHSVSMPAESAYAANGRCAHPARSCSLRVNGANAYSDGVRPHGFAWKVIRAAVAAVAVQHWQAGNTIGLLRK